MFIVLNWLLLKVMSISVAELNESLLALWRSPQLFSNSWEEKELSAWTCWRLYTSKLKGSQSSETSDETENKASQSMLCFLLKNKSDWSKLLLFWKNNEKLRTGWESELSIFIRSFLWLTPYQLKITKLSNDLSCHFIFSS